MDITTKNITIKKESTILSALKQMDEVGFKLLIVINNDLYSGLISIGDIQRSIIKNIDLNESIISIMRDDYIVSKPTDSIDDIKSLMLKIRSEFMPVVDKQKRIVKVHFWADLFSSKESKPFKRFKLPVVVMAGGFGTRLRPLTYILPKPLIPIGEKTMLEEIFDRFGKYGCSEFLISVNYKAELIKYYIKNQNLPYEVSYFEEEKPMGTAGSLSLLKNKIKSTFFVSNCDILIEQDYSEMLEYHKQNTNEITIVAALKHYPIAYGTIETAEDGLLKELTEKPELTFKINSGMYILEPHLIDEIPANGIFHITHLIEKLKTEGRKVGVFPISQNSWLDIGTWDEYMYVLGK